MHETIVKRVIWTVECDCKEDKFRKVWTENPPRESKCPHCHKWMTPEEKEWTGPEIKKT